MPKKQKILTAYIKRIKRQYKLTADQLHGMYEDQFGRCAICAKVGKIPGIKTNAKLRLVVDHCHKTGKVRGLLCTRCNTGIREMESEKWTLRAQQYIEIHKYHAKYDA